ncbi:porin [Shimia ponticola]|uniref:porin n=1 Tax=Shimia ponticola TaxID=2582893 RepID=UPI00164C10EB|nr:porin [Shimia ponticola]
MKRILLASTALVVLAGAAAAEVSWSGAATLEYNDDITDGFDFDVDLDVTLSQTLDNGLTASASFGFELTDGEDDEVDSDGFVADNNATLSLSSDTASLIFGDTAYAAETYWSGVTNMAEDAFSEADGETVMRGEAMFGGVTAGLSYILYNDTIGDVTGGSGNANGDLEQLSLGVTADVGAVNVILAYQEEVDGDFAADFVLFNGDNNANEVFGLAVSGSFGGADVTFAYAQDDDEDSTGIEVAYPIGPVTATFFYVSESAIDDSYGIAVAYSDGPLSIDAFYHDGGDEDAGINMEYDLGNGIVAFAGGSDDDGQYIGAEYDLGGGATFTASYGDDTGNDEIGPRDVKDGTTLSLSFAF